MVVRGVTAVLTCMHVRIVPENVGKRRNCIEAGHALIEWIKRLLVKKKSL